MGTRCGLVHTGFPLFRGLPDKAVNDLNLLRPLAINLFGSIDESPSKHLSSSVSRA